MNYTVSKFKMFYKRFLKKMTRLNQYLSILPLILMTDFFYTFTLFTSELVQYCTYNNNRTGYIYM